MGLLYVNPQAADILENNIWDFNALANFLGPNVNSPIKDFGHVGPRNPIH